MRATVLGQTWMSRVANSVAIFSVVLLTSDANIIPEPAPGILRVQLLGLGNDACDRMLAPLIEELNATRTIYPGTELRLVYQMAVDSPLDVSSDSG